MYPAGYETYVDVGGVDRAASRARAGRATSAASRPSSPSCSTSSSPTRAYFGQKDAQQCAVIRKMVGRPELRRSRSGSMPTVREPDGLAMSSRNVYLEPGGARRGASALGRPLRGADAAGRRASATPRCCASSSGRWSAPSRWRGSSTSASPTRRRLEELATVDRPAVVSLAARVGTHAADRQRDAALTGFQAWLAVSGGAPPETAGRPRLWAGH